MSRARPVSHQRGSSGAAYHGKHVVHHLRVFDLRAEEDELRVFQHADAVSRGPVEEVVGGTGLFGPVCVADDHRTRDHVAPMRSLARVALEALQQWSNVGAPPERQVPTGERARPGGIAEADRLARDSAGNVDLDRYLVLRDTHATTSSGSRIDHQPSRASTPAGRTGASSNSEPVA